MKPSFKIEGREIGYGKLIILSTGMDDTSSIEKSVNILRKLSSLIESLVREIEISNSLMLLQESIFGIYLKKGF